MNKKVYEYDMETRQASYIYTDHLGSVRMIADEGGRSIWEADYYAFGQQFATSLRDDRFNYGFTGKEFDPESGLNYHGARFLDSKIGRFLQVDPLFVDYPTVSQYHYCLNNPLIYVDPDGKDVVYLDDDDALFVDGHCAVLIGDDDEGWKLYSFNKSGKKIAGKEFATLDDFMSSSDEQASRYHVGVKFETCKDNDNAMILVADENINNEYDLEDYNCSDFAYDVLSQSDSDLQLNDKSEFKESIPLISEKIGNIVSWTSPNKIKDFLKNNDKSSVIPLTPKPEPPTTVYKYPQPQL